MKTKSLAFLISILIFTFTLTYSSFSQVLLDENFNYPVGDSLGAHGWNWISGSTNILSVTSPGLVYSGYPLSNIGNATTFATSGEDSYRQLPDSVNSGSVYASFMVKIDAAQRQGDYFLALLQTGSTTFYEGRLSARIVNGNINFGITKGNSSTDTSVAGIWSTGNYSTATTYLVVLKYTFVAGSSNDAVSLFVFTSGLPATEPTPTIGPISAYASADASSIGRIAIRQGTATRAPNGVVDGIRVTTDWAKITTSIQNTSTVIPENFSLAQNYPNPFNPETKIGFNIPQNGFANLTVFNSAGIEIKSLLHQSLNAGSYLVDFNGADLNSGVYFYRLNFNNFSTSFTETKKLILLK